MSLDSRVERVTICSATFGLGQGYVLPGWLKALSVRSRPSIWILGTQLCSDNMTPDQKFLHRSYMRADEVDLQWAGFIPENQRQLCLSFDLKELKRKITRILKKDQASLFIVQNRPGNSAGKFWGEGSSDDFTIHIGRGTSEREGLQSVPALRINSQQAAVNEPVNIVRLKIPVKVFRDMMGSFNKCKQDDQIKITFYTGEPGVSGAGILISSKSNLNTGNIIEKYGDIPEDADGSAAAAPLSLSATPGPIFDERSIVKSQNRVQLVMLDPSLMCFLANEFMTDADKISHFINFASLHNEGTVRVYYTAGSDLKFAFRFGPYGEQTIYISNGLRATDGNAMVRYQG